MELDRQSIEKRDFPIGRRGYEPAAVDAHLRTLASDVEELRSALESRRGETLGSSAGMQVRGILEAAEATAAEIERQAAEDARSARAAADSDAATTRADAVARAQAHVSEVAKATAVLSERIESMDGESAALVSSLRAGASRLTSDLSAVQTNMGELYDAAAGRGEDPVPGAASSSTASAPAAPAPPAAASPPVRAPAPAVPAPPAPAPPAPAPAAPAPAPPEAPAGANGDLDGVRLIALNMALNGDSRAATDRFLAEHYELDDREKLLDEVFAAVEG